MKRSAIGMAAIAVLLGAVATAAAQDPSADVDLAGTEATAPATDLAPVEKTAEVEPEQNAQLVDESKAAASERSEPIMAPEPMGKTHSAPMNSKRSDIFYSPTAHLLPAAAVRIGLGVDTGGGESAQISVGLGDVAEFGLSTSDLVGNHDGDEREYHSDHYTVAYFKMGVSEGRMFRNQPAVALGFRKSFENTTYFNKSRIAELYLAASKSLGRFAAVHAGVSLWDASVRDEDDGRLVELNSKTGGVFSNQVRPFGSVELFPLPRAKLMAEVFWVPQFVGSRVGDSDIEIRPQLAWGVGYDLASWGELQAGVRIPDIGDVNLLDAQIFAQLKITTNRLRRAIGL